jgi:hypothetical protein
MSVLSVSECNSCEERTVLLTADEFSATYCTYCGSDEMMYVDITDVDISYQTVVQDDSSS